MDVIRWAVTATFVLLGAMGVRLWLRTRAPATGWLSWMFATLGTALLINRLVADLPSETWAGVDAVGSALVVVFPYFLFRFADSFQPVPQLWRVIATAAAAVVVVATYWATFVNAGADVDPEWYTAFVLGVIAVWTGLTGWVVWRLWWAGRRQPTLARRRMTTMAVAAGLLNSALVLSGVGEADVVAAAGQVVAFASAVTFVLAFAPPRFLRSVWRQADERALWQAERDLVAAGTREAVLDAVLPHVSTLLGGGGALFIDRGGKETTSGLDDADRDRVRHEVQRSGGEEGVATLSGGVATLVLPLGRLGVATSAYTPLFGQDELELMERLGALLDLALHRVEASMTTAALSAFEQGLIPHIDPPEGLVVDTRYRTGLERLQLGGDFMDVVAIPDDAAGFIIGDVSGHGPREAAFAVGVHAGWRTLVKVAPHHPPAWLTLLDETFFEHNPERFITALAGRIDIKHRTFTLTSAGHHPPIVVGPEPHIVDIDTDPLLGVGYAERRKEHTITLAEDQALLLYTDGLIEQPNPNRPSERWREADLVSWLAERRTVGEIDLDELLWDFGHDSFADDVAIMLMRFAPRPVPRRTAPPAGNVDDRR